MNLCYFIVIYRFIKSMNYELCFTERRLAIFFLGIDRPSVLGMILLTELTAHPSSLFLTD